MSPTRHKVFISYHHDDQDEVDEFVSTFDEERDVFIRRGIGIGISEDIINSNDTDYIMRRIRELYLQDSTVTIVLLGECTWARRFVDWEIQASLRHGEKTTPNGLVGILLSSKGNKANPPNRLNINLMGENYDEGYARWYAYPKRKDTLAAWIENAFQARTTLAHLIDSPRDRFINNRQCP
jgi:hypothetical protein